MRKKGGTEERRRGEGELADFSVVPKDIKMFSAFTPPVPAD